MTKTGTQIAADKLKKSAKISVYQRHQRSIEVTMRIAALGDKELPKLLIIDDDAMFTRMLQNTLPQDLFEVFVVHSGTAGVEAVHQLNPDVIVLDLMMPGITGWETCQAIREFSQVPILIVSAVIDPSGVMQALDAGANDYLLKPVSIGVLVSHLKMLTKSNISP